MRIHARSCLLLFACLMGGALAVAGDSEDLQGLLGDDVNPGWIYDDIDAGYAKARESGKPLLIVFR